MILLRDRRGRLLLERRAPTGIWAGLWSLPEASDEISARNMIAANHGEGAGRAWRALPAFSHGFTHFRLDVTPLEIEIDSESHAVAEANDRRWLFPAEAAALGLPAPVRRLIAQLA
jgi:A/G-specific adenine glycosylase